MSMPEHVMRLIQESVTKHGSDIAKAIDVAERRIRSLPDYGEIVDSLIHRCVQELVYTARGSLTNRLKNQLGGYDQEAKVVVGESESVNGVYRSVYTHFIGGTMLGEITGDDIDALMESETAKAKGHQFNAALLKWLQAQGVIGDKRVRDVVPESRLKKQYTRLLRQIQGKEAVRS